MDTLEILRTLAIILISSKLFGLLARDLKAPQVAGEIIAGLLIGPSLFNLVSANDFLAGMAEIGVILLMFSAGLETDIDKLKKSGLKAWFCCTGNKRIHPGCLYRNHTDGHICQHHGAGAEGARQGFYRSRHCDHECCHH